MMDRFAICEGHALLEDHFNVGGIVWERPSNRRRNESTGCQLSRMGYSNPYAGGLDTADENVKEVYFANVVKWGLPVDRELAYMLQQFYLPWFLRKHRCPAVHLLGPVGKLP